uniref:Uncharacterized protein n=1 Tax=Tanacetum cinerariifolium TaxID=118510 RepID=A0A6L2JCJ6_TANCI|nr:hypothetical protein [Tanacetum cinerariifolium]
MHHDTTTEIYSCQLDEQWFKLHKDILRDALQITPINDNDTFMAPPSSDAVIEYVNTLGYPVTLKNILWGIIHRYNIDYAERICKEFVQSIQNFLTDKKRLTMASHRKKKTTPLVIPSIRFTKLIIHHLKTKHNIHPRTGAPYYEGYVALVAEYQRYLDMAAEEVVPARLVVFKEPDSRRSQPLLERRSPMTTVPSFNAKSPSLDAELADSETDSDKTVAPINKEKDASNRELIEINAGAQDEGQARSNPSKQDEGQAGSNPVMLQSFNLNQVMCFKDQFFMEKIHEGEPEKTNAKSEVQSIVMVPIHQDTSSVPPMTTLVLDHPTLQSDYLYANAPHLTSTATITTTTTTIPPPPQPQQSTTYSSLIFLRNDLPAVDLKEILQQRMFEDNSYEAYDDHKYLYEALQKSLERDYSNQLLANLDESRRKKRMKHNLPITPSSQQHGNKAPSSSKSAASMPQSMAWTTSDTRYESASFTDPDSILDEQVHVSDDEDTGNDHLPKVDMRKDWWKPLPGEDRPATHKPA